jgi:hypothetical protein
MSTESIAQKVQADSISISDIRAAWSASLPLRWHYPEVHPAVRQFPFLPNAEFESLAADIRQRGMRCPIALYEGKVIDGRARLAVAEQLGLQPKYWIVRRKDPVIFLIQRHNRFGAPKTPERHAALALVDEFDRGKAAAKSARKDWIAAARREFRTLVARPEACAVCGRHIEFVHAHHRLPLNIQFDMGIDEPDHAHDWICPVHHRMVHAYISVYMIGSRDGDFLDGIPDHLAPEWGGSEAIYARGHKLFESYGGQIHSWARWHDAEAFR